MNIKGKTKIELFDGKTGKLTHKTEDNNMITEALYDFYDQGGITNPSAFNASNIRNNPLFYLLGGVMCLDTALTEDANIIRVPAGVGMTANGARGILNSGNPIELGSWNENESGWRQDGSYGMVFDWTTSQGNGNIACVCLSSYYGGYKGIGNKSLTNKAMNTSMADYNSYNAFSNANLDHASLYLGQYNNKAFYIKNDGVSISPFANNWEIITASSPYIQIDIRDSLTRRQLAIKTLAHEKDLSGYGNGTQRVIQVGKYAYLMMAYAHTSGSYYTRFFHFDDTYPVYIFKIDLETLTIADTITLSPSTTGAEAFVMDAGVYPTMFCNGKYAVYHNLVIDMSNLVDVTEITNFVEDTGLIPTSEDIAESGSRILDMTTGIMLPTNTPNATNYEHVVIDKLLGQNSSNVFRDPRYIATINNLSSPVVKTADKTMKVTYTLSFS